MEHEKFYQHYNYMNRPNFQLQKIINNLWIVFTLQLETLK